FCWLDNMTCFDRLFGGFAVGGTSRRLVFSTVADGVVSLSLVRPSRSSLDVDVLPIPGLKFVLTSRGLDLAPDAVAVVQSEVDSAALYLVIREDRLLGFVSPPGEANGGIFGDVVWQTRGEMTMLWSDVR
ncbi:MAG: hypothetical protein ABTQ32_18015, partial [Myxococcaceae bacterium]